MKENIAGLTKAEIAKLTKVREAYRRGQRTEFPTDPRLEFARRRRSELLEEEFQVPGNEEDSLAVKAAEAYLEQKRLEMPLREKAEDIRARIEARARSDSRAARSIIKDRAKGVPVTILRMQMREEHKSQAEIINLGIVVGTDRGNEDGTVSISYLLIKLDKSETQQINARILRGGDFSVRKDVHYLDKNQICSVVYPRPERPKFGEEFEVLDDKKAKILLGQLEFLVDKCLTQPKLSFSPKIDHSRRALLK